MPNRSKVEALRSFASKVWCLRRFFKLPPLLPLWPLLPFQRSCRLAQAKQTQPLRVALPNFSGEGRI